jgi:hypothetical protein
MSGLTLDDRARQLYEALRRSVEIRRNETELREDVHALIQEASGDLYGLTDLASTGERHAGGDGRRAYDRAYGGLIVEWEWDMRAARRRHGAEQALDYLGRIRAASGLEGAFSAVVCDGKQWGFLVADTVPGQLTLDAEEDLSAEDRFEWRENSEAACRRFLVLIGSNRKRPVTAGALAAEFGPGSETTRKAITLLVEAVAGRVPLDRTDTLFNEWHRSLEVVYDNFGDSDGRLAGVLREAYGLQARPPLSELLFGVHTYFALVARLVAIEVLALSIHDRSAQPSLWVSLDGDDLIDRLRAIDDGDIPSGLHVQNLFEGDLFSWYLDALVGNTELLNAIRDVLEGIGQFAFPRLAFGANPARDVLRDLYHDLLPRELRRALGEFLTPAWLAQACLDRLRTSGAPTATGRILDPTCGTGTFLLPVLNARLAKLRSESGGEVSGEDVQRVLDSVVGFDLNPVAVIAARVNYVIAIGDLAAEADLTIPVWRADSILVPDAPTMQTSLDDGRLIGRPWQELRTSLEEPFPIPPSLANARCMPILRRLLEEALEEVDSAQGEQDFVASLDRYFGLSAMNPVAETSDEWDDLREVAIVLYERIKRLAEADRNGVWARVIENSFAPLFAGRFDVVVGNPPWLAWNKLPAAWRAAGEVHWKRYGLWRPPAENGVRASIPQIGDIATLVYATALARYSKEDGYVGLLVPKSLAIGDPGGRAFRQFRLEASADDREDVGPGPRLSFRALYADDWSLISPFSPDASNKPIFLVSKVGEPNVYPVATSQWERLTPGIRIGPDWHTTQGALREVEGESQPVDASVVTSAWSFAPAGTVLIAGGSNEWQFGLGINTRGANGIFFVDVLSKKPNAQGQVEIVNDPANGRNEAVQARRGRVESELVYPLMRGREVGRWVANWDSHIILPYRQEAMGSVIPESVMREKFRSAHRWLSSFRRILKARRIVATLNWNMDGDDYCQVMGPLEFMDGRPLVVIREIARHPAAAVVMPAYDPRLGRTATVIVDHKLVFCAVASEDEAHYVAGMLNSEPIQQLLNSFASQVGLAPGTLSRLPIPPFDPTAHAEFVSTSRAAAEAARSGDAAGLESAEKDVDTAALKLLT